MTNSEGLPSHDTRGETIGRLSVVIPAWDEGETMAELIASIRRVAEPRAHELEIFVVVPNESDPSAAPARAAGARVLAQKRPGYGGALREGLAAATGDYVVTMDADLSHPPETIGDLIDHRDDAEMVVASRYVKGGSADMSVYRAVLSRILNSIYRRALAIPVLDMSGGFRIYQRKVLGELELESEKYDVLEEILVKIYSLGWQVLEIPFQYRNRVAGQSHANVVSFTPHFLRTLFRLWRMRNSFRSADYDSRAHDSLVPPQRYWQRNRYRTVTRMAGDAFPRLDVGCGSSRIIQSSPDSIGLDIEMSKLRFLRRTNSKLLRGSLFALPFSDGHFKTVVCSQVIEHVPFDRGLFRELNRVLQVGGTLVMGTPDYGRAEWRIIESIYKFLLPNAYGDDHITHYTRHQLMELLVEYGFSIREYHYIVGAELIALCVKEEDVGDRDDAPRPTTRS
ncbi:glycosyltransferase [Myxococcota bacterium]|nr:glycosyltransferase [Myxococcota bacterium]